MTIHAPPLPDLIYQRLRAAIVGGEYRPGTPVRQDVLAMQFGVSKIPVREALARLEQDGLVLSNPRRGYEIAPMSRVEAEEIFQLRRGIEAEAAAVGSRYATDQDREVARSALIALDAALLSDDPMVSDLNRDFHLALVRPAGRPLTIGLVERLHILAERYVRAHLRPSGRSARARNEHDALCNAWTARDEPLVQRLVRAHIDGTLSDLRRELS